MSSRLHNKFHRHNHHTYNSTDPRYPDAGHDPIASPDSPFQGEFILHGSLSAYAPLSAYTAYFPADNVSLILNCPNTSSGYALSSLGNITTVGNISSVGNNYIQGNTLNVGNIQSYGKTYLQGSPEVTYFDNTPTPTGTASANYTLTVFGILSTVGNTYSVGNVHRTGTSYVSSGTNQLTGNNLQYGNNTYYGTLSSIGFNQLSGYNEFDVLTVERGILSAIGYSVLTGTNLLLGNNTISGINTIQGGFTDYGDVTIYGNLTVRGSATQLYTLEQVFSSVSINVSNNGFGPALTVDQTGNEDIVNFKNNGISKFFIEGDETQANVGFVGINTNTPNQQLTVNGSISAYNNIYGEYNFIDSSYNGARKVTGSDKTLSVQNSSTVSGYISLQNQYTGISASTDLSIFNSTGAYLDAGINSSQYLGGSYSPAFSITNANDGYIYTNSTASNFVLGTQSTTGDLLFFTGGSLSGTNGVGNERLRIKSGGNVGVNTSNPNKTLTVIGDISATGVTTLSNISFTGAIVSTFATPITANGDFLVININGTNRAIQLWNIS
jgi:hypothetical protein